MTKNADMPAMPIKINERIESANTGEVTINECDDYFSGLTKREHFAAMAMQGMVSHPDVMNANESLEYGTIAEAVAAQALAITDALLAELEKSNEQN